METEFAKLKDKLLLGSGTSSTISCSGADLSSTATESQHLSQSFNMDSTPNPSSFETLEDPSSSTTTSAVEARYAI